MFSAVKKTASSLAKYLSLLAYALTCLYPLVWMIGTSLKSPTEALSSPAIAWPREEWIFGTYGEVWAQLEFSRFFTNSLTISTTVITGIIILYSMMGFALAHINFYGKKAVFIGYIALILVPGLAVQIPLYINMVALGMADTLPGLVLPMINGAGPFAVFLFRNYFASLSRDLMESAKIDGCKIFVIYAKIYMPLSLPVIGTIAVLNFVSSWNGLQWPLIILRSRTWYTLPLAIMYLDQSAFTQWNVLMTGSMFSVIPVIVIFMMLQKSYVRGLTMGAIKG